MSLLRGICIFNFFVLNWFMPRVTHRVTPQDWDIYTNIYLYNKTVFGYTV